MRLVNQRIVMVTISVTCKSRYAMNFSQSATTVFIFGRVHRKTCAPLNLIQVCTAIDIVDTIANTSVT